MVLVYIRFTEMFPLPRSSAVGQEAGQWVAAGPLDRLLVMRRVRRQATGSRKPQADHVEWPVDVALARPVTQLPTGPYAYEIKVDGHRTVLWRTEDGVRLQARSGRDVTAQWTDLALAAMRLPPGTILDGEAVFYVTDDQGQARISFEAAQSRALSRPGRARELKVRGHLPQRFGR